MSQQTWERTLRWAANTNATLRQAVIGYQKRAGTTAWPTGVKPAPDPRNLDRKVRDLWPEAAVATWAGKG